MTGAFSSLLSLPEQDRRDVFAAAAARLDTVPSYVEKDFWVCLVLDMLFNRLADGHPKLLFKGGTSLSKAFGLTGSPKTSIWSSTARCERHPTESIELTSRACGGYVLGDMKI